MLQERKNFTAESSLRNWEFTLCRVYCRRTRGVNHRLGPVNRRPAAFDAGRMKGDCHFPGRALASGRMAPGALCHDLREVEWRPRVRFQFVLEP